MVEEIQAIAEVLNGLGEMGFWAFVIYMVKDFVSDLIGLIVAAYVIIFIGKRVAEGLKAATKQE